MAAAIAHFLKEREEHRELTEFQREVFPILTALERGGLPDDYARRRVDVDNAPDSPLGQLPPPADDASVGGPTSVVVEPEEVTAQASEPEDLGPWTLEKPAKDADHVVLQRTRADPEDFTITQTLYLRVPTDDIPPEAEITSQYVNGHMEHVVDICGVQYGWYLWHRLESPQARAFGFYNSDLIQFFTAGLIFANFVVNAMEAQVTDVDGTMSMAFSGLEMFFTAIFTYELAINFFAHKYGHFINAWNVFDCVVVFVSLLSLLLDNLPGISTLRLMRAFRVFRLFKRLESLRKIMAALANSVPGCANAFAIVILVSSIYSILGVQFFCEVGEGEEKGKYFGTFASAMLTMFQVMTGDSWAEGVSRPIMEWYPDGYQRLLVQMFFVTYILIVGVVLTNVVVAVLLEKMTMDEEMEEVPEEDALKGNVDNQFKALITALGARLHKQDEDLRALTDQIVELRRHVERTNGGGGLFGKKS
jgi:voltage-gated sodium channel